MDADLYEHLNNTITNDPRRQDSPEDFENGNVTEKESPEGQGATDSEFGAPQNVRPRTMSASLPEEIDQVVHAISSSQWAARLGSLMGSVKKQVIHLRIVLCINIK